MDGVAVFAGNVLAVFVADDGADDVAHSSHQAVLSLVQILFVTLLQPFDTENLAIATHIFGSDISQCRGQGISERELSQLTVFENIEAVKCGNTPSVDEGAKDPHASQFVGEAFELNRRGGVDGLAEGDEALFRSAFPVEKSPAHFCFIHSAIDGKETDEKLFLLWVDTAGVDGSFVSFIGTAEREVVTGDDGASKRTVVNDGGVRRETAVGTYRLQYCDKKPHDKKHHDNKKKEKFDTPFAEKLLMAHESCFAFYLSGVSGVPD